METDFSYQIIGALVLYLKTQLSLTIEEGARNEIFDKLKPYAKNMYDTVKTAFKDNENATQTIEQLESDPQNKELQASLEIYIKDLVKANNDFKQTLEYILDDIRQNIKADSFNYIILGDQINYLSTVEQDEKDSYLPFTITNKSEAEKLLLSELLKGYYTPEDILEKSRMEFVKIILPFYVINGSYSSTFEYVENTIVKIFPIDNRSFNELVIATKISNSLSLHENHDTEELLEFLEGKITFYDRDLKKFNDFDFNGIVKPLFNLKRNEAEATIDKKLSSNLKKEIKKKLKLNFENNPTLYPLNIIWKDFKRVYLPFWILIYYYNSKEYLLFMQGYDDNQLYVERKPKDNNRLMEDIIDILKYVAPPSAFILLVCFVIYYFIDEVLIIGNLNFIILASTIFILVVSSIPLNHIRKRMNHSQAIKNEKYEKYFTGELQLKEIDGMK